MLNSRNLAVKTEAIIRMMGLLNNIISTVLLHLQNTALAVSFSTLSVATFSFFLFSLWVGLGEGGWVPYDVFVSAGTSGLLEETMGG